MKLNYKLKNDLIARTAASFVFDAQKISGDMHIIFNNKRINTKSLLSILCGKLEKENICTVDIEKTENLEAVKELFSSYAEEV